MESRFEHYCESCKFLGQHKEYDVYLCSHKDGEIRTLLFRFGNKDSEYKSSSLFTCAGFTEIDKFALLNGLKLNEREEKHVVKLLRDLFVNSMSFKEMEKHTSKIKLGTGNLIFPEEWQRLH